MFSENKQNKEDNSANLLDELILSIGLGSEQVGCKNRSAGIIDTNSVLDSVAGPSNEVDLNINLDLNIDNHAASNELQGKILGKLAIYFHNHHKPFI